MEGGQLNDRYPSSGTLNRKVTLQSKAITKDAYGNDSVAWTTYATPWAEIEAQDGGEVSHDKVIVAAGRIILKIRYHPEVTHQDRIMYGSRIFLINSVVDVGEQHAKMRIIASEVKNA